MPRRSARLLAHVAFALLSTGRASAAPTVPGPVATAGAGKKTAEPPPTLLLAAVPARVEFVAFLPVAGAANEVDLDLRVEVVLPRSCGDRLVGLLRRGGVRLDAPDAYDPVLERDAVGECGKDAVRLGGRQTVRVRLADGGSRDLQLGERVLHVARAGRDVTVDGAGPVGDVPGARATTKPRPLVEGDVTAARVVASRPLGGATWMAAAKISVSARWPACAEPAIGLLAHGDAGTHFALTRFSPIAHAALDGACKATVTRSEALSAPVRLGDKGAPRPITVGPIALTVDVGAAAP